MAGTIISSFKDAASYKGNRVVLSAAVASVKGNRLGYHRNLCIGSHGHNKLALFLSLLSSTRINQQHSYVCMAPV